MTVAHHQCQPASAPWLTTAPVRRALLAAILAAAAGPAMAQSAMVIGRLFATPKERAELDAQRYTILGSASVNGQTAEAAKNSQGGAPPPGAPVVEMPPLQLNGVVRRSDGRSTIWLNQQPQLDGNNALQDQTLSVRLPSGQQVRLKPGQSFNPVNGTIQDDPGP